MATAVAEIREASMTFGVTRREGGRPRARLVWTITWRGPCGAFSSGQFYYSRAAGERMAQECGAKEIEYVEAAA